MGLPVNIAKDQKISQFCKVISEFALEYRTTRDKVMQQLQKKQNQRERKKTRGKMILGVSCFLIFFSTQKDFPNLSIFTFVFHLFNIEKILFFKLIISHFAPNNFVMHFGWLFASTLLNWFNFFFFLHF